MALAAEAAERFAAANREAVDSADALGAAMERIPGAEAAAKLAEAGSAARDAARGEAEAAAGARDAAGAMSEEAGAAAKSAVANKAAAESAGSAGRAAFNLANFERALNAQERTLFATTNYLKGAEDKLKDTLEALAFTEKFAAEEAEKLARAEQYGSLAAAQNTVMARNLVAANIASAMAAEAAASGIDAEKRAAEAAAFAQRALAFANGEAAMAAALEGGATQAAARAIGDATEKASASAGAVERQAVATKVAAAGFRLLGTGIRITGTMLHWIVAGTFEFLATAVPAAIALGAGMMVAAQGAQMAQIHLQSLYTVTEATANIFHTTFGQALGMKSALQQAQDAANPGVYEILGSAINDVKARFQNLAGVGLQVVHMLDAFSARVTLDLKGAFGKEIQGLLAGMVTDLQRFGQVFGNLGHAMLNFAAAMPGLAAVLLAIVTAVTNVILAISSLPPWILTTVMAIEEFYRWGGVALRLLIALAAAPARFATWLVGANFITKFGSSLLMIVGALGKAMFAVGAFIAEADILPAAVQAAGAAMAVFGIEVDAAASAMLPLLAAGIALAAAGFGFLMYKVITSKDAIDKWVAATDKAVQAANGLQVFPKIAETFAANSIKMAQAQATLNAQVKSGSAVMGSVQGRYTGMGAAAGNAAADINTLRQQQQFLSQTAVRVIQNSVALGHQLHVTAGAALLFATAAGVNLQGAMARNSTAFKLAVQQILNLQQGYRAMGASAGAVGNDMTAVAIQAGLQTTQVQKLTQAWDAYMQLLTGGTSGLAGFELGLKNMTTGIAKAKNNLSSFSGTMNLSVKQFASSLQHFTGQGAQAWQNFNQVVGSSAQQFIDWMNNAAAVGMVTGPQLSGAIKGVVAQLIPFAAKSATARAELAGLVQESGGPAGTSLKSMEKWARQGGMSTKQLGDFVGQTTRKLSNMAQVAANLGTVMQNSLVNMFDQARLKASGLTGDLSTLGNDVSTVGVKSSTTHGDMLKVVGDMSALHVSVPTITALINSMGIHISQAGIAAIIASGKFGTLTSSAAGAGSAARHAASDVANLAAAIDALHSKTINVNVITTHQGIFVGGGGPRAISGHASGTSFAQPGLALVGEQGRELIQMHGAERVFSNPETEAILGGGQHPGLAAEAGGGAGGGPQAIELHSHVYIDGKQVFESVKQHGLVYNTRNSGSRTGKYIPGP